AWEGFAAASLIVPELSLARRGDQTWLTANGLAAGDDVAEQVVERIEQRLAGLRDSQLPLLDPVPTGRYEVASPIPPAHFEAAVARATERIRRGEMEKIVLA